MLGGEEGAQREGLEARAQDFGFYSECSRKPPEGSEQRDGTM